MQTQTLSRGDVVDVAIYEPGGATPRLAGTLRGTVLNAGIEVDVVLMIDDVSDYDDAALVMERADVRLDDLRERLGSADRVAPYWSRGQYFVLRNCQPEWVQKVTR